MQFILGLFLCAAINLVVTEDASDGQRVVGGHQAYPAQFPYQVSLRRNNQHFCGGSIIDANTILTAAHCVYGSSTYGMTVVAGTNHLNYGGQQYQVISATAHEAYNPSIITNDIAVIKVSPPITFTTQIQPVQLATSESSGGEIATLSGWGLTSYPGSSLPHALQYINLHTIDLQTCAQVQTAPSPITTGHVCTHSAPGYGACQGDSGGPLVSNGQQIGVVSWGVPCARGAPDVFTSVAFYRDWILSN